MIVTARRTGNYGLRLEDAVNQPHVSHCGQRDALIGRRSTCGGRAQITPFRWLAVLTLVSVPLPGAALGQVCCDGSALARGKYEALSGIPIYPDEVLPCQLGFGRSSCVEQRNVPCSYECTKPKYEVPDFEFNAGADIRYGPDMGTNNARSCSASVIRPESGPVAGAEFILTSAHCLKTLPNGPWYENLSVSVDRDKDTSEGTSCAQRQACVLDAWIDDGGLGRHDIGIVRVSDCDDALDGRLVLSPTGGALPDFAWMIGQIPNFGKKGFIDDQKKPVWPDAEDHWQWVSKAGILEKGTPNGPDYLICHSGAVKGGTSGSAIILDDLQSVFCVNSRSGSESIHCKSRNVCAPVTPSVKEILEAYMISDESEGLTCNPKSINP